MKLLIDDTRDIGTEVIARTWGAGHALICRDSPHIWDVIYFDHDLGGDLEDTGYTLLSAGLKYGWFSASTEIGIVTNNPVGRIRMVAALKNAGYTLSSSTQLWSKEK